MQCMTCGNELDGKGRCLTCDRNRLLQMITAQTLCWPSQHIDPLPQHEWNRFFIRVYDDLSSGRRYTGTASFGPEARLFGEDERRIANTSYSLYQFSHWDFNDKYLHIDRYGNVSVTDGDWLDRKKRARVDEYRINSIGSITVTESGFYYLPVMRVTGYDLWSRRETLETVSGCSPVWFSSIDSAIILNWDVVQLEFAECNPFRLVTPAATLVFALYCLWKDPDNRQLPLVRQVWQWA